MSNPRSLKKQQVLAIIDEFLRTQDPQVIQPNTFSALNSYFNVLLRSKRDLSPTEQLSFAAFKSYEGQSGLNKTTVMQTFSNIRDIVNKYNNTTKRSRNNNNYDVQKAIEESMKNESQRLKKQKLKQEQTNRNLALQLQVESNEAVARGIEAAEAAAAGAGAEIERRRNEIEHAEALAANPNNIRAINNFARQLEGFNPEVRINGVVPEFNNNHLERFNLNNRQQVGAAAYALAGIQALMQTGVSKGCNLVGMTGRFISWACGEGVPAMNALLARINVLVNIYAEQRMIPANIKKSIILAINGFKSRVMRFIDDENARDNMIRLANETDQRVQEIPQELTNADKNIYEAGKEAAGKIREMGPVINGQFMRLLLSLVESENAEDFGIRARRAECSIPLIHTTYEEEKASAAGVLVQFVELVNEMNAMNGEAIPVSNTTSQKYIEAVEKRKRNGKPIKRNIRTEWTKRNRSNGIGVCVGGTVEDVTTFIAEMRGALPMTADTKVLFSTNLATLLNNYINNMISSGLPDLETTFRSSLDNLVVTLFTPLSRAYVKDGRTELFIYLYEKVELYLKYFGYDQIKEIIKDKYPLDPPIIVEYRSQGVTEEGRSPWNGEMHPSDYGVNDSMYYHEIGIIDAPLRS